MTRWTTFVALILATLTFAAPAGAQTGEPELGRVLAARAQAGAARSAEVERAITRQEHEAALTARGKALNEMLAPSPPAEPTASRFDWGTAASGAGATLALVLGALGSARVVRRRRKAVVGPALVGTAFAFATLTAAVAAVAVAAVAAAAGPHFSGWSAAQKIDEVNGNSSELNTPFVDGCPIQSPDGRSLYLASNRPGGEGGLDIWVAHRESKHDPWGAPQNLGEPVNSAADDFCPTPIRGGGLFFVSREALPGSCGMGDIYFTRYKRNHGWSEPERLACAPEGPNSALDEQGPSYVTAGGPRLYFSRSSATVAGDIYVSRGVAGSSFGPATPVAELNDPAANDIQPNVRKDGREIVFSSNRAGTLGSQDIWVAARQTVNDAWSTPVNLGPSVNTGAAETRPSLSWQADTLLFGRAPGPEGMSDIYLSTRERLRGSDR